MKSYLIIPMGGTGSRFIKAGYKEYKSFLPINFNKTLIDNIFDNFKSLESKIIVLLNKKKIANKNLKYLEEKKCTIIDIPTHRKGPLYSIFLGLEKINKIIKDEQNIFICYSDINWIWNFNQVKKQLFNTKAAILTHTGFHPHLLVNSKSDFCLQKNKRIIAISEKKTFTKNYEKEYLALGCYYFKDLNLINYFFHKKKFNRNKEYYLTSLIGYLLKRKIYIKLINIKKFVHLGTPDQYEDYLKWQKYFSSKQVNKFKKNDKTIMLMAGKGQRLQKIVKQKPFLIIDDKPLYKFIFDKMNSKKKYIITNSDYRKRFKKNYTVINIKKTNSMFDTIYESRMFLSQQNKYFLTSCDCFGIINKQYWNKFIQENKSDMVFFAFNFSNLQRRLRNAHTQFKLKNNKIIDIEVKKNFKDSNLGHAGFFWINKNIFKYLDLFKKSKNFNEIKREIVVDDYFKFLITKKLVSNNYFKLDDYIHIGSEQEYLEYKYWRNFFNENKMV